TNARLVERALVKVEFNGVCHSSVGTTCAAKKRQAPRRGDCTRKAKAEPGVLGSGVFTEASTEQAGSHNCRPVKESWHAASASKSERSDRTTALSCGSLSQPGSHNRRPAKNNSQS